MGTKLLVCMAGAGIVQCPFDSHDRSANFVGRAWSAADSKELAFFGNRIDCCWVRFDRVRRLSNRTRGCDFSLCAFAIIAMGNGTVRCGWAGFLSPGYRVPGFPRCLRRARSLRRSIAWRECALAATISNHHRAAAYVAGSADAGATRERNGRARERGRYRALVTASAEMVWRANAWGEGFFVSPSWQELTGQSENEMRDFGWLQAVYPDDRERARRLWERAMIEKHAYENELRVRIRDGSYKHFYVHAVPILAPDGDGHEWVGANIDITERKQSEQALQDLVAGTGVIGEEFFPAYVRHVAAALDVHC